MNVNDRFAQTVRTNRLRKAVGFVEILEERSYLTGVVLAAPQNLATSPLGLSPVFSNIADFNGDGKGDLYVANSSNSVSVLLSNGDGTFGAPVTIPVQGTPLPLVASVLTTSGHEDIVAGSSGSPGDISIIRGNGDGTFQAANNIPALNNNQAIAVGHFKGASAPADIVTISNNATPGQNIEILFTDGNGNLASSTTLTLNHGSAGAVVVGDFNKDGFDDFAVVDQASNTVTVFMSNGDGTFKAGVDYATGASPTSIVASDFNNDGNLDLVTADSAGGAVSFLAGNGDGTFKAPVNTHVAGSASGGGPLKVRTANFTGTNSDDLITLLSPGSSGDATILLSNGDGTWHTGTTISTNGGTRNAIAAGNLTGLNGLTDIVLTNSSQISTLLNRTGQDTGVPTATLTTNPPAGSPAASTYAFTVTYTDSLQIDAATLGNGNLIVTAPAGVTFPGGATTEAATLVSQNLGNAASVTATYQITFPSNLSTADQGAYGVSVNANSVTNANGVPVAAGSIGSFNLTVTGVTNVPTAAIDASQAPGSAQSNLYNFNVTYTDATPIDATTLGNGNITVTFPDTSVHAAALVSSGLANGTTVHAVYQIAFAGNLTTANNGTYTASLNANSVKDTAGTAAPAGVFGAFVLAVSATQPPPTPVFVPPTGVFSVGGVTGKIPLSAVTGSKDKAGASVTVTNGSTAPITGTVTVTLYSSSTIYHDTSAVALKSIVKKVKKLKPGKGFKVHFPNFTFPTAGTQFLVADAALNGALNSNDGASSAITVAAAFVDGKAVSVTPQHASLKAGKKLTVTYQIQNIGNVPFVGTATADIIALSAGGTPITLATGVGFKLNVKNSATKKGTFAFVPGTTLAAGTYTLTMTIHIPGDADAANDTVTSTALLTTV